MPRLFLVVIGVLVFPWTSGRSEEAPDFAREVLPILSERCYVCHGPDAKEDELRLDSFEGATADLGGYYAIDQDSLEDSELIFRIHDEEDPMPPRKAESQLTDAERDILTRWVRSGAKYAKHWAFVPPKKPAIENASIDTFIAKPLQKTGHDLAKPADKPTLARRAALTLTGLPPELDQLTRFLNDDAPEAFENLVDELLASPRFGEHHARYWLDAVRYGDTHGLHLDNRRGIFPYRDWVVKAFNENLPFDDFITWQLAGDLLPDPTLEQLTATGYVRMNPTTSEGGAIPAEFQAKNNFDRVENLGTIFLGMTLNCARCHTHKYDPIQHQEYFEMFAFFNSTKESPMDGNAYTYAPVLEVPSTQAGWQQWPKIKKQQTELLAAIDQRLNNKEVLEKTVRYAKSSMGWKTDRWQVSRKNLPHGKNPEHKDWKNIGSEKDVGKERLGGKEVFKWVKFDLHLQQPQTLVYKANAGEASQVTISAIEERPNQRQRKTPERSHYFSFNNDETNSVVLENGQEQSTQRAGSGALKLDGKTQYILDEDQPMPKFSSTKPFAISAWVRCSADSRGAILSRMDASNRYRGVDFWTEGLSIGTHIIDAFPSNSMKVMSKGGLKPDQWNHVVLNYDGSQDQSGVTIYINGRQVETNFHTNSLSGSVETSVPFKIGSRTDNDFWQGEVDDIQIFDETLTTNDVALVATGKMPNKVKPVEKVEPPQQPFEDQTISENYTALSLGRGSYTVTAKLQGRDGSKHGNIQLRNPWHHFAESGKWHSASEIDRIIMASDAHAGVLPESLQQQAQDFAKQLIAARGGFTTTLIAQELPNPRETKILERGEYSTPIGDPLQPAVFSVMNPFPENAPKNRLGLAQWLLADDQPLVSRVLVNRIWQTVFGEAIVRSPEDFGLQGRHPTHPELLDWLAISFREQGWDYKKLVKNMVMSRTFQQDSAWRSELKDPDNLTFGRGPSFRLDAEVIRDTGLWASGLLQIEMGGEGVKPWQPEGMWAALSHPASNTKLYVPDIDQRINQRSIYVYWKRTSPHPMMTLFDAPSREVSCVRRSRGNTPLQSLGLLNEPQRLNMARNYAHRLINDNTTAEARLNSIFSTLTCRPPSDVERNACLDLLTKSLERYQAAPEDAKALTLSEKPSPELAAWTQLVNTLLASDAAILLY